jgi:DNA-binding response OmpR family regulator
MDARLLLISDEPETRQVWGCMLHHKGIKVCPPRSIEEALERWTKDAFDMVIIDVYTPQLNEVELSRRLRAEVLNPILLFTFRQDESYVLEAYRAGVDECILKPISPLISGAKVMAWLRRSWTVSAEALPGFQVGDFCLDPTQRQVVIGTNQVIKLTNLEFRLLYLLMNHRGQVLETNLIIDRVWSNYNSGGDSILLKNLIYRLRHKIELDPHQPHYILTVAGEGYTFQPA